MSRGLAVRGVVVALLAAGTSVATYGEAVRPACSDDRPAASTGGDWPTYGADLANSRRQAHEQTIGAANVSSLTPAWSFWSQHESGVPGQNNEEFDSTPIEAFGCVYVGSAYTRGASNTPAAVDANVFALDATTGAVVWSRYLPAYPTGTGGAIIGAPVVVGHTVVYAVDQAGDGATKGPYLVALDRSDGSVVWQSRPLKTESGYYTNGTPVLAGAAILIGFSGEEGEPTARGGFALIDPQDGALLKLIYTIPPRDWWTTAPDGTRSPRYGGGGIWSTAAVDRATGYAYVGTGNPYSKAVEHPRTNAILKIDVDRQRDTFGEIVASYTGNVEQDVAGVDASALTKTPACPMPGDETIHTLPTFDPRQQDAQGAVDNSQTCGQLDLDFGAAANLFRDPTTGALMVGDLQKSGVYHAVRTDTMSDFTYAADGTPTPSATKPAWMAQAGESCEMCNASSTAYDPVSKTVFADVSPGTVMVAISTVDGSIRWRAPVGDGVHYESVTYTNGVVYTIDNGGGFDAFDASSGKVLLHEELVTAATGNRSVTTDTGTDSFTFGSGGISIARHLVIVADGSHIIAMRVPA